MRQEFFSILKNTIENHYDHDQLGVFADWLEDHGEEKVSRIIRDGERILSMEAIPEKGVDTGITASPEMKYLAKGELARKIELKDPKNYIGLASSALCHSLFQISIDGIRHYPLVLIESIYFRLIHRKETLENWFKGVLFPFYFNGYIAFWETYSWDELFDGVNNKISTCQPFDFEKIMEDQIKISE